MAASELAERVAELIYRAQGYVPEKVGGELKQLEERLREPVRVAVVGRVKAGKSTLVNALLGQVVAPTDVSECTKAVTWFRYGHPQRLVIRMKDGSSVESQLGADSRLPQTLDVPIESVAHLDVYLANETLRWVTLVDTPGIGSVHEAYSSSTEELLKSSKDSAAAAARADAVVFLLNQVMMEDELTTLKSFGAKEGGDTLGSAASAVGVLTRADQLGDGSRDPWQVAVELADHYAGVLRHDVATVVPVIGLVAECSEAATLTELDARNLATLASMDEKALRRMLWSTDRFVTAEAPVPPEARERLLTLLDLYGVGQALGFVKAGNTGAVALRRQLSKVSGIAAVKKTLTAYFRDQDHVLKVRSALHHLNRLSYSRSDGAPDASLTKLRSEVEALRLDPAMHPIAELEVWHDVCSAQVQMSESQTNEMQRLFAPGSAAARLGVDATDRDAQRAAAKDAMVRWRSFMITEASPAQARVCRVVLRSYQLIWEGLK
jgi:hypothetical protein